MAAKAAGVARLIIAQLAMGTNGDRQQAVPSTSYTQTNLHAEMAVANELVPYSRLCLTARRVRKAVRVCETTNGVATHVLATRVELATVSVDVELGVVDEADDGDIRLGTQELNALESALGHEASTVGWLGAVRDRLVFSIA